MDFTKSSSTWLFVKLYHWLRQQMREWERENRKYREWEWKNGGDKNRYKSEWYKQRWGQEEEERLGYGWLIERKMTKGGGSKFDSKLDSVLHTHVIYTTEYNQDGLLHTHFVYTTEYN